MKQLVECVPNFSEGRDRASPSTRSRRPWRPSRASRCWTVDPGADTNRTVVTLIGEPAPVAEAAFQGIRAAELIDMSVGQRGPSADRRHRRSPFVPVSGVTMADCAELAWQGVGRRVGDELGIPVYLHEAKAASPKGQPGDVRAGSTRAWPTSSGIPPGSPTSARRLSTPAPAPP